jgi:hypothetical protein
VTTNIVNKEQVKRTLGNAKAMLESMSGDSSIR